MSDTTLKALEAGTGGTDLGAISVMQGGVPVKVGKTHLVAADGSDAIGASVTAPPNGTGVLGWLRGIYDKLSAGIGRTWNLSSANDSVTVVQGGAWSAVVGDGGGSLTVDGTVNVGNFPATQAVSGTVAVNQGNAGAQAWPVTGPLTDTQLRASAVPVSGPLTDAQLRAAAVPVAQAGATGTDPTGAESAPVVRTISKAVNLCVSAVGASAAAVTATLPAVAGQYHYITKIEIVLLATVARTAAATGVTVTSTNLPGGFAETFNTSAQALGTTDRLILDFNEPLKSSAVNTPQRLCARPPRPCCGGSMSSTTPRLDDDDVRDHGAGGGCNLPAHHPGWSWS